MGPLWRDQMGPHRQHSMAASGRYRKQTGFRKRIILSPGLIITTLSMDDPQAGAIQRPYPLRTDESRALRVRGGRNQKLATKKTITPFEKIFLDSRSHFEDYALVIALQTTASTTALVSGVVAAGQPKLPHGNDAACPRRTAVDSGF